MKLPKKYQGITPGYWVFVQGRMDDDFIITDKTGCTLTEPNHPVFSNAHEFDPEIRAVSIHEARSNGTIMADSPRLAAAVVLLRETIEKGAANRAYAAGLGVSEWPSFLTTAETAALESTKEWEA